MFDKQRSRNLPVVRKIAGQSHHKVPSHGKLIEIRRPQMPVEERSGIAEDNIKLGKQDPQVEPYWLVAPLAQPVFSKKK